MKDCPLIRRGVIAITLVLACAAAQAGLWVDAAGRPTPRAGEALSMLAAAGDEGLTPADYGAQPLAAQVPALPTAGAAAQAAFDTALDAAVRRYLHHLHSGRVDPRRLGFRLPLRSDPPNGPQDLLDTLDQRPLSATAQASAPPFPQYRQLREALAHYRSLAANASLALPALPAKLQPGDAFAAAADLARLLKALGDLPADATVDEARYDGALVEAVRRFQSRHVLAPDGVIGQGTRQALLTPMTQRARQIELAMERLRWIAPPQRGRFLAINIPTYRLWAWDPADPAGTPPLAMGVIVGKALNTRTPVLQEDMRHLIFRPYWNVPRSILLHELLPKIRRSPGTLQREDLEIVRGESDEAQPVPASEANLQLLQQGALRLRQRPGERNSLGLVKFVFPNDDNVYLHGTPAQSLFQRARRDFSHGCVRVEDPLALAQWVLREQPQWTRERIEAAMAGMRSQRVNLQQPVPVLLFYTTAFVSPEDGRLHFADDIYGHDRRLEQALRLPEPHAARVHVHEVRGRIEAHAAALQP